MSLREHERRILEEIERQLSEEEPDLAGRMESFGSEDPDAPADPYLASWRPWVACALIAAVTAGLLVLLFVLTPSTPQPSAPTPAGTSQTTDDPVPEENPLDTEPANTGPNGAEQVETP
ncbi:MULTISPECIES: DUF3040 domain-containing protein [Nocardiopsis]|uniref:DUF3040 domain-containing protein n=1 Tax=Nocardiopsis sinuspersici TaxID=501010 RepID=A0A1V3C0G5_9ACTN|nr:MULTISPECIES: DUF3040 domain-containing protein [Nocardiopsis]OOC54178.1 hypothetical protein NOSIN_10465 [Nocardiopsis sinuspersici]